MTTQERASLAEQLKKRALGLGFSLAGIAGTDPSDHMGFYGSWIAKGNHGEMGYLSRADAIARRADLRKTVKEVQSVLVVAHEYHTCDPEGVPDEAQRAVIARYARGDDYHEVVLAKLLSLLSWLQETVPGDLKGRAYVDTGPILERELAKRAGLGWFGRNTMLINPERGSYFFIGALLLDLDLLPDTAFVDDRCGSCTACLDACPTGALLGRDEAGAPIMDARRCISYLTIELRGAIPKDLRSGIGNRVFGCDICQEVCPWNEQFARPTEEVAYWPKPELNGPDLRSFAEKLLSLDEAGFRKIFKGSPLLRAKREGLLRNLCVALGNWGDEQAVPALVRALSDESALVRQHAAWALGQTRTVEASQALSDRLLVESTAAVRAELDSAIGEGRGVSD